MQITPFYLERWFGDYEFKVPYNLAESHIEPLYFRDLLAAANDPDLQFTLFQTQLAYEDSQGGEGLRAEVAKLYPSTGPENILITNGAIEANYLLFRTLLEPGDNIIYQSPAYQQLFQVAQDLGVEVRPWVLEEEANYEPDLEKLAGLVDEHTRLLVVNNPNNPTGAVIDQSVMKQIVDFCQDHKIWLLSDEVYEGLILEPDLKVPAAREFSSRVISVSSLSKGFGLPGLRIGWLAAPEEVVVKCWELRDYTSICPSKLSSILALIALRNREKILARHRRLAKDNLTIFQAWAEEHRELITYVPPRGGVVLFPRYNLEVPSEELCRSLIESEGVLLAPGSTFEQEYHLRLGFGCKQSVLIEGLQRLSRHLRKYRSAPSPF